MIPGRVETASLRTSQLRQLISWLVPVAFGFAGLSLVVAVMFGDTGLGVTGGFIFVFGCLLFVARRRLRAGRVEAAVVTICTGILGTTLAVALVQPYWYPTLVITSLLTVMVALPYTEDRILGPLLVGSWVVALAVVLIGRTVPYSTTLPFWVRDLFLVASLAATVATLLLLLWQFRSRLTRTLRGARAAEERYALAVRATNDGIWDWDLDTGRVYYSPRWRALPGLEEGEVGEEPAEWFDRVHPDDRERVEVQLREHLDGATPNFESEHRMRHRDGHYLWVLTRGVAVRDGSGKALRVTGSQSNVDERRRAEEELKKRAMQLESYNAELEQFAYSISHELRAPLRWISGFSRMLLEDHAEGLGEDARDYLGRILVASDTMGERVDSLLEIARLTRRKLEREPLDLSSLVGGIVENLKKSHPESDTEFVVARGLTVEADERLIRIAVENLLDNAWKFTRGQPHPRIEFGAREEDGERVYFVRDNGVGFDEAYADNLFGPFQRLHEWEDYSGTGLGLATVQRIIHRHGGQVWAQSGPEGGAAFYFTL